MLFLVPRQIFSPRTFLKAFIKLKEHKRKFILSYNKEHFVRGNHFLNKIKCLFSFAWFVQHFAIIVISKENYPIGTVIIELYYGLLAKRDNLESYSLSYE